MCITKLIDPTRFSCHQQEQISMRKLIPISGKGTPNHRAHRRLLVIVRMQTSW
jgi:hypothetical protein